jgi:hypothetical protein
MDLRKAALIATWLFFWLATLVLYFYNVAEFGSSLGAWYFQLIGLIFWDLVIFAFWFGCPPISCPMIFAVAIQAGFVCFSAIFWICTVSSVKIGIWLMIATNLIKFIPQFIFYYIQRPTQVPQLISQPRPNLLANQPPTALTNFEDVEQPPPSYEECMAQRNDLPPKYEDLELPPPAYQETMV